MNNNEAKNCPECFDEEARMTDLLNSQKYITGVYNNCLCETETQELKNCLSAILMDEHRIQEDIFSKMQQKGWYQTEKAQDSKIMETKTKYSAAN